MYAMVAYTMEDLEVKGIEKIHKDCTKWRRERESYWIFTLRTLAPDDMNLDEWRQMLWVTQYSIYDGVVWLAEVGWDRLVCLSGPDVGAVSIHSDVQGILRLFNILQTALLALY